MWNIARGWAAALVVASLACAAPAVAAEGDLAPSFGNGGRVATTIGAPGDQEALTIDAQGRLIVAGGIVTGPDDADFMVARYLPNGAPDASFSGDGVATFDRPGNDDWAQAQAVTTDAAGGILLAGYDLTADSRFALIRVSGDGTLDTGFGPPSANGWVITNLDGSSDSATAIAVDAQGRILLGGWTKFGSDEDFAVERYDADGNVDTSFGSGGEARVDITPQASDRDFAQAMALDAQGRIVLAGSSTPGGTVAQFAVVA